MSTLLLSRRPPGPSSTIPAVDRAAAQRRALRALVAVQVAGGAGLSAGATVVALIAVELSGSAAAAGLPHAASVAGTAAAAVPLAVLMRRRGRRPGLRAGWWLGALGAAGVVAATVAGSLPAFILSLVLLGCAGAASNAARHVATDLASEATAGRAVGTVVAATAVSTAIAPLLAGPLSVVAGRVGLPTLAGPFLLSVAAFATAGAVATVLLRPDPLQLARQLADGDARVSEDPGIAAATDRTPRPAASAVPIRRLLRRPAVLLALASTTVVNASMVALMAITPVHLAASHGGHGDHLGAIGPVISLHIAAMFAPSPFTGRLVDRLGAHRVVAVSAWLVVAAGLGAQVAGPTDVGLVAASMVLLGLGWNGSFVAGSSLLASAATPGDRPRVQGVVDATAGGAAMLAGILAGVLATTIGYAGIGVVAGTAAAGLGMAAGRLGPRHVGRVRSLVAPRAER